MHILFKTVLIFALVASLVACAHHVASRENQDVSGEYLIVGVDVPGTQSDLMRLADAHWDYIDRFAPQLVARGPLISDDGTRHLGSVHVINASSFSQAERFASQEPYNTAKIYSIVTVTGFRNILGRTMWEHSPIDIPDESTFIRAQWPATSCTATQAATLRSAIASPDNFAFLGFITTPDGSCTGIAAGAYLYPERAKSELERLLEVSGFDAATIEATRWRRGGRKKQR